MHSGKDPAQSRLSLCGGEAWEWALRPGHDVRRHLEIEPSSPKERLQHERAARADNRVRTGIRRVWSCLANLRKPVRIHVGVRICVCVSGANRGNRSPEVVSVLRVIERYDVICKCEVQQGK